MSIPPCLMRFKIGSEHHYMNLWLPLFLAWIILGALAIALSPLVAFLVLVLWPLGWGEFLLLLGPAVYNCICASKGLRVDIEGGKRVLVYFV
jgi:hypothetical protein